MSSDPSAALRDWARGLPTLEAAVELLVTTLDGRLLDGPWIRKNDAGGRWCDPDLAAAQSGHQSGGEKRVLTIACSLARADHPVVLGDAITGIDPDAVSAVLTAMVHASGIEARPTQPDQARRETKAGGEHSEQPVMDDDPDSP